MFVTDAEQKTLRACFALLAEDHSEREIRSALGSTLLDLFRADHFASYIWSADAQAFEHPVSLHMDPANLRRYEAWYQYRDPITFLLQSCRHATLVEEVIDRPALLASEFFNDFLARDGLHWGMNLHAFHGSQALGDLRIWRSRHRPAFDGRDKILLDLIEPAFVAALRRARDTARDRAPAGADPQPQARLSRRELEVARHLARGLTNKEIARALGVSLTSVNTYLARIYDKLGVRRRSAVIALLGALH